MIQQQKKRIEYIDIAKGITILLVILTHCLKEDNLVRQYIVSFDLPLFYLLSGYFFKEQKNNELIKKGTKRLLIPYFTTSIIIALVYIIGAAIKQNNVIPITLDWLKTIFYGAGAGIKQGILGKEIGIIGAIWFLLSLFWIQILFNNILKIKNKTIRIISLVCSSIIGFVLPKYIWLPLDIDTAFIGVIFFAIGYKMKQDNFFERKINILYKIAITILWMVGAYFCTTYIVNGTYNLYYINIIVGIMGSYLVIELSKKIDKYTKKIKKLLCWCGQNSLYILCVHGAEGRGIIPYYKIIKTTNSVIIYIIRTSIAIIGTLIIKNIKKLIGKERYENLKKSAK